MVRPQYPWRLLSHLALWLQCAAWGSGRYTMMRTKALLPLQHISAGMRVPSTMFGCCGHSLVPCYARSCVHCRVGWAPLAPRYAPALTSHWMPLATWDTIASGEYAAVCTDPPRYSASAAVRT